MPGNTTITILAVTLLATILSGCGRSKSFTPGVALELAESRAAVISDLRYALTLDIPAAEQDPIRGFVRISFDLGDDSSPLALDFREAGDKLKSLRINGRDVDMLFENEHILLPRRSLARGPNEVEIDFVAGSGSLNRNPDYLYTLFVPDRARTAFPLFDQPDLKARFTLTLNVPSDWTALSNAPVAAVDGAATGLRYEFAESDLISSYLFSFVAGRFETVTREIGGHSMTMLHRETDAEKVARNLDAIFELHAAALAWLEEYTGIDYPYRKFGFALIPAFQYGGMEHVGAIQYRASSLLLDEAPSQTRLLARAGLIAHETAHMWFGNLVTMEWFNDVWTKEVFANFMAAKIVNPSFPDINHDLNFLVRHYPAAYSVDRTEGANPIRQTLPNLNEAGQMYGAIIYNKAPIMMRQLEAMIGEEQFRDGLREYLQRFAFGNATWPKLIEILDARTERDLAAWGDVWVNTPGRPEFEATAGDDAELVLVQRDPSGEGRNWPQTFSLLLPAGESTASQDVFAESFVTATGAGRGSPLVFNANGMGYGLFPATAESLADWEDLDPVARASLLINLYENMLEGNGPRPAMFFDELSALVTREQDQLVLNLALGQLSDIYWRLIPVELRRARAPHLEQSLWRAMLEQAESSRRKIYFDAYADIAVTADAAERVRAVWSGEQVVEDLPLSEDDRIDLAQQLAIRLPDQATSIIARQLEATQNPDSVRKLEYIAPSLASDRAERDRFFHSLADESMRATESWVLDALGNLHHPLRIRESEDYILPSLELLQEIQVTGDIFFPKAWLDATLANHRSASAVKTVRDFLAERPNYNRQLRMKLLQSADKLFRANEILMGSREAREP